MSAVGSDSSRKRPITRRPELQLGPEQRSDEAHLSGTGVERRYVAQRGTPGGTKFRIALMADLVDGLQAVHRESRADGIQMPHATLRELHQSDIRVGLQPLGGTDPGLEAQRPVLR